MSKSKSPNSVSKNVLTPSPYASKKYTKPPIVPKLSIK